MNNKIIIDLLHEGDMWDVVPNHSTTINLIILQKIAMELAKRLKLDLYKNSKAKVEPPLAFLIALQDIQTLRLLHS